MNTTMTILATAAAAAAAAAVVVVVVGCCGLLWVVVGCCGLLWVVVVVVAAVVKCIVRMLNPSLLPKLRKPDTPKTAVSSRLHRL